jgi:butyrate kinase
MKQYNILTINPGSTSTKFAFFKGEEVAFIKNINHEAEKLADFKELHEQLGYRRGIIIDELQKAGISLGNADAFVGAGGGLLPIEGGVYIIGNILLNHATTAANGVIHPANLAAQIAAEFSKQYNKPSFIVNAPDTDEFCDLARVTGLDGVYRTSHLHALNQKETAIRHAKYMNKLYKDCNFIVCHIGGGVSIAAHEKGRMIDGNDIVGGEGPMTPTRCGTLPVVEVIKLCYSGKDQKEVKALCTKNGGFVHYLGTSDAREVIEMAKRGNKKAARIWTAMIYQICKYIGSMATVLHGQVDGILLGGGMIHDKNLVSQIEQACKWIAPVSAYPGEFEMEAMAAGAIRVLRGEEAAKEYTGIPIWDGFND